MDPIELKGDATIVAAVFNRRASHVAFALGDGSLRLVAPAEGSEQTASLGDGAVLAMVADLDDSGWLAGLDDGRVVRIAPDASVTELAKQPGKWIEQVAASPAGL